MNWPKALVNELAARRCIIFLGSGASAGCLSLDGLKHPPNWINFLRELIKIMKNPDDLAIIEEYLVKEKFLEAAEIIIKNVPTADFTRFIRETFEIPRFKPSKIHECVLELDPKIVVTTNYDSIYDRYCTSGSAIDGYNVSKYYEQHITSDLRSPVRLIIKAHGCVTDAGKIVLSKSQYFNARQTHSNFYKVLDALFLTNTILFVGYSLTDPDIQLVLENVNIATSCRHPHYFITGNSLNGTVKEAMKLAYNIDFIEFKEGDYAELNNGLGELTEEVREFRVSNPSI